MAETWSILTKHLHEIETSSWRGLPELTNENGSYCVDSCRTQVNNHLFQRSVQRRSVEMSRGSKCLVVEIKFLLMAKLFIGLTQIFYVENSVIS